MIAVRELAAELKLTEVSVRQHCRTRGIETFCRLPEGQRGGQMRAFVDDDGAAALREYYADRVRSREG